MRYLVAIGLALLCGVASANDTPTSIGGGRYMLTHHNFTIFGSADSIVADLIIQANEYCKKQSGSDAYLLNSDTSDAASGALNNDGTLHRAGKGATGTIYFQCTSPQHVESEGDRGAKLDNLAKLKALLDSGAITQK